MATGQIDRLLEFVNMQMAAEAFLSRSGDSNRPPPQDVRARLELGNTHASTFTPSQAAQFVDSQTGYDIVAQYRNDNKKPGGAGFSATLFKNRRTGELTLSIRSTEFVDDAIRDSKSTGAMEIRELGWAFGQIAEMEEFYRELKLSGELPANTQFNVTGYSLGGHLATAFALLRKEEADLTGAASPIKHIYTFNGAGTGGLAPGKRLTDLLSTFNELRSDPNSDIWLALPQLERQRIGGLANQRVLRIQQEKQRLDGLSGVRFADGQKPPLGEQAEMQYQIAALVAAKDTVPSQGFLKPGVNNIPSSIVFAPVRIENMTEIFGAEAGQTETEFLDFQNLSFVSFSGLHHGKESAGIYIESQPIFRGNYFLEGPRNRFQIVSNQTVNDFADTHSLVLLVDSLSLMAVLERLDPNVTIAQVSQVFAAASNSRRVTVPFSQGRAEGDTLERTLDALVRLFVSPDAPSIASPLSFGGNTWHDSAPREAFHQSLAALNGAIGASVARKFKLVPLAGVDRHVMREQASLPGTIGAAWRYALVNLNPFVLEPVSADAVPAQYNEPKYGLFDATENASGLTTQYLIDRAGFLWWKSQDYVSNGQRKLHGDRTETYQYIDRALTDTNGNDVAVTVVGKRPELAFNPVKVVFAGDGGETLVGTELVVGDRLYGGEGVDRLVGNGGNDYLEGRAGNDTLEGGAGADVLVGGLGENFLEGGVGFDTYKVGVGKDHIRDQDGLGLVVDAQGRRIAGRFVKQGSQYVFAADPTIVATFNSPFAITLANNASLVIENFGSGDFGMVLTEDPRAPPARPATDIGGTAGPDSLSSHHAPDPTGEIVVFGREGHDYLSGAAASDWLFGDDDSDLISAGRGDNFLFGGDGGDIIVLGAGRDFADGGPADDFIGHFGGSVIPASLTVTGRTWQNTFGNTLDWTVTLDRSSVSGAWEAKDFFIANEVGVDVFLLDDVFDSATVPGQQSSGGAGNDFIVAGPGGDTIFGEEGNDTILALLGDDNVFGGAGSDFLAGGEGDDYLEGEDDPDTLYGEGGDDLLFGGAGNDHLEGDSDTIAAAGHGDDYLDGDAGDDTLIGQGGTDSLFGGAGNDILIGDGDDIPLAYHGDDHLNGEDGNDILAGHGGNDWLFGGKGDDELQGGLGNDYLDGEGGNDVLSGDAGDDEVLGGAGDDQLAGGDGNDHLDGEEGSDTLWGGARDDTLLGDAGHDRLDGGDGNDALYGGAGDDLLAGGEGEDLLAGGPGADTLEGGAGNDTYFIGAGDEADTIRDSEGVNRIVFATVSNPADLKLAQAARGSRTFTVLHGLAATDVLAVEDGLAGTVQEFELADAAVYPLKQILNSADTGPVVLTGEGTGAILLGGGANDSLAAGNFDTLDGGRGDDLLAGASEFTQFVFSAGDGADLITGGTRYASASFTGTVDPAGAFFTRADPLDPRAAAPRDLVLNYGDGDSILIHDSPYLINWNYGFDQGTFYGHVQLLERSGLALEWTGTAEDEFAHATKFDDLLEGGGGDDMLPGLSGNDTLAGGSGNDTLEGGSGDDILIGGPGNDRLTGDRGDDTYRYGPGDGTDIISDRSGVNHIEFGPGIGAADLTAELVNGTDGGIYFAVGVAPGATLLVQQSFDGAASDGTMQYSFADGTTIGQAQLAGRKFANPINFAGTNQAVSITGSRFDDTLIGSTQDDRLDGGEGGDRIAGGAGRDVLIGGAGDDLLVGNDGDDTLDGGPGNDGYRLHRGMGRDRIIETAGDLNALILASDLSGGDLGQERIGEDLYLHVKNSRDGVHIQGYFAPGTSDPLQRWQVTLADGASMPLEALLATLDETGRPATLDALIADFGMRARAFYESALISGGYAGEAGGSYRLETVFDGNFFATRTLNTINFVEMESASDAGFIARMSAPVRSVGSTFSQSQTPRTYQELVMAGSTFVPYASGGNQPASGVSAGAQYFFNLVGSEAAPISFEPGWVTVTGSTTATDPLTGASGQSISGYRVFPQGTTPTYITRTVTLNRQERTNTYEVTLEQIVAGGSANIIETDPFSVVDAGAGDDTVTVSDVFVFVPDAPHVSLLGTPGALLFGNAGNDRLIGGSGDDVLVGGTRQDVLTGGGGNDTYRMFAGDGVDVIYDDGATQDGIARENILVLPQSARASGLIASAVQLLHEVDYPIGGGVSLPVKMLHSVLDLSWGTGDGARIILPRSGLNAGTGVDVLQFSDRSAVNVAELLEGAGVVLDPQELANDLESDGGIHGGGSEDTLRGAGNVIGGAGRDALTGSEADDNLFGGEVIYSGIANYALGTLWDEGNVYRGGRGADTLWATAGSDVFHYELGDGYDTVTDLQHEELYYYYGGILDQVQPGQDGDALQPVNRSALVAGQDTLRYGPGIAPGDISVIREYRPNRSSSEANFDSLTFIHHNGADAVRFRNWFMLPSSRDAAPPVNQLARVEFADGTVWDRAAIDALVFSAPRAIAGSEFDDVLFGSALDDRIFGLDDNDFIIGGAGNDVLDGGPGDDTYYFSAGFDVDTIAESGLGTFDVVLFDYGITPDTLTLGLGSLLIRVGDGGDAIHMEGFDPDDVFGSRTIELFRFADGAELAYGELLARGFDIHGTFLDDVLTGTELQDRILGFGGNDALAGGAGDDVMDGGGGDDLLIGGSGNDTYVFESFSGRDRIEDGEGDADVLRLGAGIAAGATAVTRSGAEIALAFGGGRGEVAIRWQPEAGYRIERIAFLNGEMWDAAILEAMAAGSSNTPPALAAPLPDPYANQNAAISLVIPDGTLVDLDTGKGDDGVDGGAGGDLGAGNPGDDLLFGEGGNDGLYGGKGTDQLYGEGGDDRLFRGEGEDRLDGGKGSDVISGVDVFPVNPGDGKGPLGLSGAPLAQVQLGPVAEPAGGPHAADHGARGSFPGEALLTDEDLDEFWPGIDDDASRPKRHARDDDDRKTPKDSKKHNKVSYGEEREEARLRRLIETWLAPRGDLLSGLDEIARGEGGVRSSSRGQDIAAAWARSHRWVERLLAEVDGAANDGALGAGLGRLPFVLNGGPPADLPPAVVGLHRVPGHDLKPFRGIREGLSILD